MKQKRDPRIGLYEKYNPLVCAATGQHVDGRHSTTMRLKGNYFCRVLNKLNLNTKEKEALKNKLLKLIPATEEKQGEVKHDK